MRANHEGWLHCARMCHFSSLPDGVTGFGQTNFVDEIKIEQAASNSEQSASTHGHVATATTNQPQNDSYKQQVQSLTDLLRKLKETSKSALMKQLT